MHGKNRTKPFILLSYEALFRRLRPDYRQISRIWKDYLNYSAGYQGERNVDYTTSIHPLPQSTVYHDIRLKFGSYFFQIDTLIVTPTFILILEVKNMTGELSYDSMHDQFIQTIGTERKRQRNPIQQSLAQKIQLAEWLKMFNLPTPPIETLSVISNPNAIIVNPQESPTAFDQLIHVEALPKKLHEIATKHSRVVLDRRTLHKLDNLFKTYHTPNQSNLLQKYNIENKHLISGVSCEKCGHYPLKRPSVKWVCSKCGFTSKTAHEQLIYDFFLLHKPTLTNSECRHLLQLGNRHQIYYLLKGLSLRRQGVSRNMKYHAPPLEFFHRRASCPKDTRECSQAICRTPND
ncbi:nuclease-related domain-containing protein [Lentibacillus saliphilus]|uniref:nuclease-related domain-containing protein n=1 Tax=Lentibacillus saliphilus TaxID=2737028 RepID=UPI001C2F35FD|nr:nuclease-related domain-containing protein [Lentibacillus saliphilus]